MMLLAARRESVNVVFPWSTCPQIVIFRVVSEFDTIGGYEHERGQSPPPATLPAQSQPPPTPPTPPPLLPETETMTVLRYDHCNTHLAPSNDLPSLAICVGGVHSMFLVFRSTFRARESQLTSYPALGDSTGTL